MLVRILVLMAVVSAVACSSVEPAPKMQYYLLDTAPKELGSETLSQIAEVKVISMPDYLNQSSLVMMLDNHKMEIARYHNWAERLNRSMARVVEYEYNKLLLAKGADTACAHCYRIALSIEHFYPTSDGDVFLSGFYEYKDKQETSKRQRFNFQGNMQSDGYQAAVEQMRALLILLSQQITEQTY